MKRPNGYNVSSLTPEEFKDLNLFWANGWRYPTMDTHRPLHRPPYAFINTPTGCILAPCIDTGESGSRAWAVGGKWTVLEGIRVVWFTRQVKDDDGLKIVDCVTTHYLQAMDEAEK